MNLTLKNIKHAAFASEETYCYSAVLYLDGKALAIVGNDGQGGCDYVHPATRTMDMNVYRSALEEITAFFLGQPEKATGIPNPDGTEFMMRDTLETWCSYQVSLFLAAKEMSRELKKHIIFVKNKNDSDLFRLKIVDMSKISILKARIKKDFPDSVILNDLSKEDAFGLWLASA